MLEPTIEVTSRLETAELGGEVMYWLYGNLVIDESKMDAEGGGTKFRFALPEEIWRKVELGDRLYFRHVTTVSADGKERDAE